MTDSDADYASESPREECLHCGSTDTERTDYQFTRYVALEMRACVACGEGYIVEYSDPEARPA